MRGAWACCCCCCLAAELVHVDDRYLRDCVVKKKKQKDTMLTHYLHHVS